MSEGCNHDCSSCGESCGERENIITFENPAEGSEIKRVIGVVSGKGGVGKSLVTSMLAVNALRAGYKTAILDADITGPSIPTAFGVHEKATCVENGINPTTTDCGIDIMSVNLLLDDATGPVVWRGPIISGVVKQFWTDVLWGEVDYMFVDMPPGTGDVPLTVFQSIPVDGIVIVSSPQELVKNVVEKAVKMANMMNIPILGIVENMSYITCPDCGKKINVFGESNLKNIAEKYNIKNMASLPVDSQFAKLCDEGRISDYEGDYLKDFFEKLLKN